MFKPLLTTAPLLLLLPSALGECGYHYFGHCEDMITHWYDPLTGEVCDPLDCGGGRAPPKTNVPGCGDIPAVTTVSYMSCWTEGWMLPTGEGTKGIRPVITADWIKTTAGVAEAPVETSTIETTAAETTAAETTTAETTTAPETSTTVAAAISTGETASASAGETAESSAITSTTPLTTPSTTTLATLPTLVKNGTATPTPTSSTPEATENVGSIMGGSLVAVVGAVVGVIAFL